jgi:glycosyltransferase involved in cell wall biosynthesis
MKIWIVNHYARSPDTPGGTRHFGFATELVKRGHQVSIFASSFGHRTRKEERLEGKQNYRRENVDGVEFIWVRTFPYYKGNDWRRVVNMLSYSFRVIPLGLRLKERPDVILASSPHPFAGLAGYILARLKRARFIFEVRDLWPQTLVEFGGYSNRSPVVKLLRVLEKFLCQRAKKIVLLAPKASDYITRLGIPTSKIVYIPNGVDPKLFSDTSAKLPSEIGELISGLKSEGKILVGYAGAHGIANAMDTIIETPKLLQDEGVDKVHFLLVGDGPEKGRLVGKAESWGLSNISFFEPIPKYAMPALLRAIDIAVISVQKSDLYKYGVSFNKLFDYMICAKPVVWAIDLPDNPVAKANCGITVSPEDAGEMAKAIVELCDLSEKEREDMGMGGYEYVMKYHSMPVLAGRLLEAIKDV